MNLSVIVATHNRSQDMSRLLTSLDGMSPLVGGALEIIVVDNGSTDDTPETVEHFRTANAATLRYVSEPTRGKALALNRGVQEAKGDILAFVDDDIIVSKTWATEIDHAFRENPELVGLGGRVELFAPRDENITVRTRKEPALIELSTFTPLSPPILGCNMAFRAGVFKQVGLFDDNLGPGSTIGCADDMDFLYRVLKEGLEIRYLPEVLVYHNHGRSTPAQVLQLRRRYVKGRGAFYFKFASSGDQQVKKWAYWELRNRTRNMGRSLFLRTDIKTSWQTLVDLATGALISWRVYSRLKGS